MTSILASSHTKLTSYRSNTQLKSAKRHSSVPPSLNKGVRAKESERITAENNAMLRRL